MGEHTLVRLGRPGLLVSKHVGLYVVVEYRKLDDRINFFGLVSFYRSFTQNLRI